MNRFLLALSILIALSYPALGDEWHFPGKGSRIAWERATKLYSQSVDKLNSHDADQAIALLKQAIAMYPYDPYFYKNLGLIYENEKKDFPKAENFYQKAIRISPTNAAFQIGYAGLLFDEGKVEQSRQVLRKAEPYITTDEEKVNSNRLRSFLQAK